jgi:hypothetical protein
MLTPMSPSQFQNILNVYLDFHRVYLFRVLFFDGLVGAAKGAFVTDLISSTDTPVSTTNDIKLGWMGSRVKLTGKTEFQDWKVTVRDDATSMAYSYFQDWRDKVYNVKSGQTSRIDNTGLDETLGLGQGYKKSAIVIMFGNKISTIGAANLEVGLMGDIGAAVSTRAYLLSGIWPKDIGAITLDYSTENIATFPVTFAVDYFSGYSLTGAAASLLSSVTG